MYFDSFVISMMIAMAVTGAPMVWTLFQFLKEDWESKKGKESTEENPPNNKGTGS